MIMLHRTTLAAVTLALLGTACAKPASASLDDVLEEFGRYETMNSTNSCECFELIAGDYTSEQECLDAGVSIEAEHIECMKNALATVTQDEAEAVELVECFTGMSQESADCLQTNIGVCSADTFSDCIQARGRARDECDLKYSDDDLEAFWLCRL